MKIMKMACALALLLAVAALATPAQAAELRVFGKCLDVKQGILDSGAPVQLYTCNNTAAQGWELVTPSQGGPSVIKLAAKPELCLDVMGGTPNSGTRLQVYTCNGTASQSWDRAPFFQGGVTMGDTFRTRLPGGRCLDVTGGITADGTPIQIYDCNGTASQTFAVSTPAGLLGAKR